jgi:hypothetical protein
MTKNRSALLLFCCVVLLGASLAEVAVGRRRPVIDDGIQGVVTAINGNSFIVSLDGNLSATAAPPGTKIDCDANTAFFEGASPVNASDLKVGASVHIACHVVGNYEVHATKVTVIPPPPTTAPAEQPPSQAQQSPPRNRALRGIITKVGEDQFIISLNGDLSVTASPPGTEIFYDVNTKVFDSSGAVDASELQEGMTVRVIGHNVGYKQFHAIRVRILPSGATAPTTTRPG